MNENRNFNQKKLKLAESNISKITEILNDLKTMQRALEEGLVGDEVASKYIKDKFQHLDKHWISLKRHTNRENQEHQTAL